MRRIALLFLFSMGIASALVDAAAGQEIAPSVDIASQKAHPPKYPRNAIDNRLTGKLLLSVLVSEEGNPLSIKVERASPPEAADIFGDAAREAMMQWSYRAGTKDGKPYAGYVLVPLDFSL